MKKLFTIIALALTIVSCQSGKQAALNDLRDLTVEIQQNAHTYNFKEWLAEERRYEKIDSRLRKYDYTEEESREIGELKGECLGWFAKGVIGKATNKIQDAANQIQGIIDGIQKALKP